MAVAAIRLPASRSPGSNPFPGLHSGCLMKDGFSPQSSSWQCPSCPRINTRLLQRTPGPSAPDSSLVFRFFSRCQNTWGALLCGNPILPQGTSLCSSKHMLTDTRGSLCLEPPAPTSGPENLDSSTETQLNWHFHQEAPLEVPGGMWPAGP